MSCAPNVRTYTHLCVWFLPRQKIMWEWRREINVFKVSSLREWQCTMATSGFTFATAGSIAADGCTYNYRPSCTVLQKPRFRVNRPCIEHHPMFQVFAHFYMAFQHPNMVTSHFLKDYWLLKHWGTLKVDHIPIFLNTRGKKQNS